MEDVNMGSAVTYLKRVKINVDLFTLNYVRS